MVYHQRFLWVFFNQTFTFDEKVLILKKGRNETKIALENMVEERHICYIRLGDWRYAAGIAGFGIICAITQMVRYHMHSIYLLFSYWTIFAGVPFLLELVQFYFRFKAVRIYGWMFQGIVVEAGPQKAQFESFVNELFEAIKKSKTPKHVLPLEQSDFV